LSKFEDELKPTNDETLSNPKNYTIWKGAMNWCNPGFIFKTKMGFSKASDKLSPQTENRYQVSGGFDHSIVNSSQVSMNVKIFFFHQTQWTI
jgi:hypothetical protein